MTGDENQKYESTKAVLIFVAIVVLFIFTMPPALSIYGKWHCFWLPEAGACK